MVNLSPIQNIELKLSEAAGPAVHVELRLRIIAEKEPSVRTLLPSVLPKNVS